MHKFFLLVGGLFFLFANAFGQKQDAYETFAATAMKEFGAQAENLIRKFELGSYDRWDMKQETGELVFSKQGVAKVIAKVQIVGSFSTFSNTWRWSWANKTVLDANKKEIHKIKEFGEKKDFKKLTTAQWEGIPDDGWEMTAITGYLLKAEGFYRAPISDGMIYFIITDMRWAEKNKN